MNRTPHLLVFKMQVRIYGSEMKKHPTIEVEVNDYWLEIFTP